VEFHQDALGTLGEGAAPERAFEVVVFGEAAQHDVSVELCRSSTSASEM
jgi:hypothetical protein